MHKPRRTKSPNNSDKLTAHFTTGQLVIAICVTLLFAVTTFLLGVLVGRYDPSLHTGAGEPEEQTRVAETPPEQEEEPTPRTTSMPAAAYDGTSEQPEEETATQQKLAERLRQKAAARMAQRDINGEETVNTPRERGPRVRELTPPPGPTGADTAESSPSRSGEQGYSIGAAIRLAPAEPFDESSLVSIPAESGQTPENADTPESEPKTPEDKIALAPDEHSTQDEPPALSGSPESPAREDTAGQPAPAEETQGEETERALDTKPEPASEEADAAESEPSPEPETTTNTKTDTAEAELETDTDTDTAQAGSAPAASGEDLLNEDAAAAPPLFNMDGYGIQVASFLGEQRASRAKSYQKELETELQCDTTVLRSNDDRFYRVVIVGYADRASANAACAELKVRPGFSDIFVRSLSDDT